MASGFEDRERLPAATPSVQESIRATLTIATNANAPVSVETMSTFFLNRFVSLMRL